MSFGRPDYNLKVIPVAEVIGDDEESYYYDSYKELVYNDPTEFYDLTIPSTYDLYISHIIVSSAQPGSHQFILFEDGDSLFVYWFDTLHVLDFSGSSIMKFESGKRYQVVITSESPTDAYFTMMLRGFKRLK